MIKFVFMSPDTWDSVVRNYDEKTASTGVELLRELLLPRRADVRNVLLADLPADEWLGTITKAVFRLPPQIRNNVMVLLERLAKEAVIPLPRPKLRNESDAEWQENARRALADGELDVLFVRESETESEQEVPIAKLQDDQWLSRTVERATTITRDGAGQERLLRRLLYQNPWCGLQFPYVRAEKGDELYTVLQILQLARESPNSRLTNLDLLLKIPLGADETEVEKRIRPALEKECQRAPVCRVRVFRCPESFLDREMLFGKSEQCIRWYVTAGHVATHPKSSRDTTTWTLRSRSDVALAQNRFSPVTLNSANILFEL